MQILLDALLIAVFALFVFRGFSRGLARSVFRLGRMILSFAITALLGSSFSRWINQCFVYPRVYQTVHGRLTQLATDVSSTSGGSLEAFVGRLPKAFRQYVDLSSIEPSAKVNTVVEAWSHTVTEGLSRVVSTVLGFVLLFALSFLALTVVIAVVGRLVRLPVIRTVDKLLGLGGGIISGMIAVWILALVLGALFSLTGHEDVLDRSLLLRLFTGGKERIFN